MIGRAVSAVTALASAALAGWLALNHPISPLAMMLALAVLAGLALRWPGRWPLLVLPLLPVCGLMPWSGWLVVEELDLIVLAVAAGAYAGLAVSRRSAPRAEAGAFPLLAWVLIGLFAISTTYAMFLGVADAGGWRWGWWQGYREPLNAVRLAKPVFEVLLLLPLWSSAQRANADQAHADLRNGLLLSLLMVALGVVWERLAFTGLLNFSSDYRATGLFWEMHVGGAALDAMLAMTLPGALAALAVQRRAPAWLFVAGCLGLGLYAAMVTFSRIVYIAVPVGVLVGWLLRWRQGAAPARWGALALAAALLVAGWAAAAALFPLAGYRGLLALTGAIVITLPLPAAMQSLRPRQRLFGLAAGLALAVLVGLLSAFVPKGAYVAVALTWLAAVAALLVGRRTAAAAAGIAYLAAVVAAWFGVLAVSWFWAGGLAIERAALVAAPALLLIGGLAAIRRQPWPAQLAWQGQVAVILVFGMAVVAVFGGGAYMGERMQGTAQDSQGRQSHWRQSLSLLRTDGDSAWGLGLGRYLAQQAVSGVPEFQTGDYRLIEDPQGNWLRLTSGSHVQGWGEVFRVSQRIAVPPPGGARVRLRARPEVPLTIHVEVCEKHLLYSEICMTAKQGVKPSAGDWQPMQLDLKGSTITGGPWYAPRFVTFSMAVESTAGRVDVDDVSLIASDGRELLANGGFERGMARWFFSSDRHHMPWHAKNLAVHLWFEQGLVGLSLFALAVGVALGRCTWGRARRHPLAPMMVSALVGALIVGMVDSLLDMPRVAFMMLGLTAVALSLPGAGPSGRRSARP